MADDTVKTDADSAAEERLFRAGLRRGSFLSHVAAWMVFDGNARQISYYKTKRVT